MSLYCVMTLKTWTEALPSMSPGPWDAEPLVPIQVAAMLQSDRHLILTSGLHRHAYTRAPKKSNEHSERHTQDTTDLIAKHKHLLPFGGGCAYLTMGLDPGLKLVAPGRTLNP